MFSNTTVRKILIGTSLFLAGIVLASGMIMLVGSAQESDAPSAFSVAQLTTCDQQESGQIALMARLAVGYAIADARAQGYVVIPAIDGAEKDLVVLQSAARAELSTLRSDPTFSGVGPLLAQSADPSLRSCMYRLEDSPRAAALARTATDAMVQNEVLTSSQVAGPGTTFLLSDDPTDSSRVFLTVVVPDPLPQVSPSLVPYEGGSAPPGGQLFMDVTAQEEREKAWQARQLPGYLDAYVAVMDKSTGQVISMGHANWYSGQ